MLEAQNHDRNANVPTTPTNDALTILIEEHVASDQPSQRPCKRHCPSYLSQSLAQATTDIDLASEAEARARAETEAVVEAETGAEPEAVAERESEAEQEARAESEPKAEAEAVVKAEARAETEPKAETEPEVELEAEAEAEAAQVPHPLTADNLAALPDHSAQSHPSPISILTSTASTGTDTSEEMTVAETRTLLNRNRLFLFDNDAQERARKIIEAGNKIRERRRDSSMSEPILETLVQTIKKYANKGEKTFMFHLWKALLNDTRKVPDGELTVEDDPKVSKWFEKAWDKDYIWGKWEADFASANCPRLEKTGEVVLDAIMSSVPRITSPRPDLAYGFDFDAFDEAYHEILHQIKGGRITGQQFCTFFAVEAKCGEQSLEAAENQCCRTGATMAKGRRDMARALLEKKQLLKELRGSTVATPSPSADPVAPTSSHVTPAQAPSSNPSVEQPSTASTQPRPDKDTICFTLAVCPQIAKMCIHFAETWPDGHSQWQMHRLRTYLLEERDHVQELHHDIDNILDWGCSTLKRQVTAQLAEWEQITSAIEEVKKVLSTIEADQAKASTPGSKRKRAGG